MFDDLWQDYRAKRAAFCKLNEECDQATDALRKALEADAADQIGREIDHPSIGNVRIRSFLFRYDNDGLAPVVRCRIKSGEWGKVDYRLADMAFDHERREWRLLV
jgi:hypothetical protein